MTGDLRRGLDEDGRAPRCPVGYFLLLRCSLQGPGVGPSPVHRPQRGRAPGSGNLPAPRSGALGVSCLLVSSLERCPSTASSGGVVLEKIWRTYVWASGKRACFFVPCKLAACGPPHRLSFSSKLLASHERPCGDRRTNSRERERVSTQSRESPGVSSPCAFIGIGRRDGKKGGARNSKRRGEDREGRGRSPSASKRRSEGPKVRGGPRRSAEASSELGFCERFVRPFCGLGPLGRRVEAELQRVRDEATDLKAGAPWRPGASRIVTLQLVAPAKHRKAKHPAQLDKLRQTLTTKLLTQL